MQRSTVIVGALAAGVAIALITSIAGFATLAENQSNSNREQDEKLDNMMSEVKDIKSGMSMMSESMDRMIERMDTMMQGMDMMMGMITGDMMMPGDMMGPMEDMMSQEPQDVIIKRTSGSTAYVGKEAEIVLLVLDKETQEPLEVLQVLIHIERGPSMMGEMMGDMFEAEDKGSGEYIVRFTPDTEGQYTIHVMVMLPGRSMMDNHIDFGVIAEVSDI